MQNASRHILGVFFFGALFAGGLYAGYAVVTQLPLALAAEDWPATQGTVTKSELRRRKGKATRHTLVYSYQVDGRYYDGKRVAFMGGVFRSRPEIMAQRYAESRPVTVRYAPDRPAVSILETGVWWIGFGAASLTALVFLAVGSMGLRATFR